MRVYTGHQLAAPREAFFVFARSRKDALDYLAGEDVEVDESSLRLVRMAGAVLFRAGQGPHPGEAEAVHFDGELPKWWAQP